GHDALVRSGAGQFLREEGEVQVVEAAQIRRVGRDPVRGGRAGQNPRVGAARHGDAAERVGDGKQRLERARHGPATGAAGEHEGAVDIEQEDSGHSRTPGELYPRYPAVIGNRQLSLRTLPARGPFAEGSSSNVTR